MPKTKPFHQLEDRARLDQVRRGRFDWDENVASIAQAMEDALDLAALRQHRGVTQVQLAERLHIAQGNVSQLEHREELYLSTLREYVEALGGRLDIAAVFPEEEERVPLAVGNGND
jgi:DNA-binding XRE family transcriptional regulator